MSIEARQSSISSSYNVALNKGCSLRVSLLITTFNRADALGLVLKTVARQSRVPDEVVICDDGSSDETRTLAKQWEDRLPIRHVWQPDRDFRAARSRNLGALKSHSEYVVWIDGDCLLPPRFMENHIRLAKPGYLVAGGRHLMSSLETNALLSERLTIEEAFKHWKFKLVLLGRLRDLHRDGWKTVRTCNLGLSRKDLDAVNGFDESYVGWGREDSDLVLRLMHCGVNIRSGRFAACVGHLYHAQAPRGQLSRNDGRFNLCVDDPNHMHPKKSILEEP